MIQKACTQKTTVPGLITPTQSSSVHVGISSAKIFSVKRTYIMHYQEKRVTGKKGHNQQISKAEMSLYVCAKTYPGTHQAQFQITPQTISGMRS